MRARHRYFGILRATLALASATGRARLPAGEPGRMTELYAPFLEWSAENPSHPGNPFDVSAVATFTHEESGEMISTGLFYDGGDVWKWRFTGTRLGMWTFRTTRIPRANTSPAGIGPPRGLVRHEASVAERFA